MGDFKLINKKIIEDILARAPFIKSKGVILKYVPAKGESSLFTVVVGKSVAKLATKRNLIKRRIREAIRKNLYILARPLFIVLIARKSSSDMSYKDIETETKILLSKLEKK